MIQWIRDHGYEERVPRRWKKRLKKIHAALEADGYFYVGLVRNEDGRPFWLYRSAMIVCETNFLPKYTAPDPGPLSDPPEPDSDPGKPELLDDPKRLREQVRSICWDIAVMQDPGPWVTNENAARLVMRALKGRANPAQVLAWVKEFRKDVDTE